MTPALARLKSAVRSAIGASGGIEGAALCVERGHSVVGEWNNRMSPAFPSLDKALALDEVARATGHGAPVLQRLAAELGFAVFPLPEMPAASEIETALIAASAEFGDVSRAVLEATEDARLSGDEAAHVADEIDQAMNALARLRVLVTSTAVQGVR